MMFGFIRAVRQNHALEHATVALLMSKVKVGTRLLGRSTADGFYIYGDATTEAVSQAAEEGLSRLKKGEYNLAVSPFCGTNLVVTAVLAGLAAMFAMRNTERNDRLPNVLLASLAAVVVAQPLGRIAQKHITTSTDVADVDIVNVSDTSTGKHTRHKIKTLRD